MKKYKISTPDADEYLEKYFIVNDSDIVVAEDDNYKKSYFIGKKWGEVYFNFASVWKSYSSKCNDNVYPKIEEVRFDISFYDI